MPARRERPDTIARSPHSFDGRAARRGGRTYGGVDVLGSTRDERYERARKLGVRGRSRMRTEELARANVRKQR